MWLCICAFSSSMCLFISAFMPLGIHSVLIIHAICNSIHSSMWCASVGLSVHPCMWSNLSAQCSLCICASVLVIHLHNLCIHASVCLSVHLCMWSDPSAQSVCIHVVCFHPSAQSNLYICVICLCNLCICSVLIRSSVWSVHLWHVFMHLCIVHACVRSSVHLSISSVSSLSVQSVYPFLSDHLFIVVSLFHLDNPCISSMRSVCSICASVYLFIHVVCSFHLWRSSAAILCI